MGRRRNLRRSLLSINFDDEDDDEVEDERDDDNNDDDEDDDDDDDDEEEEEEEGKEEETHRSYISLTTSNICSNDNKERGISLQGEPESRTTPLIAVGTVELSKMKKRALPDME